MGEIYQNLSDKQKDETTAHIKLYHGFGNGHDFFISGHVIKGRVGKGFRPSRNLLRHNYRLAKMYMGSPNPNTSITLWFETEKIVVGADENGYFEFQGKSEKPIKPGWKPVFAQIGSGEFLKSIPPTGWIFIPDKSRFLIISDIDDTVLISHSTRFRRRMREMIFTNPFKRRLFSEAADLYAFLEDFQTEAGVKNPVFYVSASEWNLFSYLSEIFEKKGLPKGPFLLHPRKHWTDLLARNRNLPLDKLERIEKLLHFFPDRKAILLGDNSQKDPQIYLNICSNYPQAVAGVFIRLVSEKKKEATYQILSQLSDSQIPNGHFVHSAEAVAKIRQLVPLK